MSQSEDIQHIGPMAQDFHAAFSVGDDERTISTIDPDGVALAAIQELAKLSQQKDAKIADLESRIRLLEEAILQFGNHQQTSKQ